MAYINFKSTVKSVNLKGDGDVEIKLLVSGNEMRGRLEMLHSMINEKVTAEFDSTVVTYHVQMNARTSKPITQYQVDDTGVVHEVKPEGKQVEMDLGLLPEKIEIKEESNTIDLQVIIDFILESLAPEYDDLPYDFYYVHDRLSKGATYNLIATEMRISSSKLSEMTEEYRRRVAPLAQKWDDWRQGKEPSVPAAPVESVKEESQTEADPDQKVLFHENSENFDQTPQEVVTSSENLEEELPDWMRQELTGEQQDQQEQTDNESVIPVTSEIKISEIDREQLEEFILKHKPQFDDLPYDFPTLLAQRRDNSKSWMELASELKINSSKLTNAWTAYRKRVARKMLDSNGAA